MLRKTHAWLAALAGAAVLLSACTAHMEGRLAYPPEPPPAEAPPRPPEPTRPRAAPRRAPPPPPSEPAAPPGVYFLHDREEAPEGCVLVGERITGGDAAAGQGLREELRANAVLELAAQARWLGGNVVVLPHFREDYRAGHLLGRVYRCDEPQRRAIYRRAAAERNLTVVPP